MFLDGPQTKSIQVEKRNDSSSSSKSSSINANIETILSADNIDHCNKLNNNDDSNKCEQLKNERRLVKSLARLFQTNDTKLTIHPVAKGIDCSNNAASANIKSQIITAEISNFIRKPKIISSTTIDNNSNNNDIIDSNVVTEFNNRAPVPLAERLTRIRSLGQSVELQNFKWIPSSLKASLQRSLSLKQQTTNKPDRADVSQRDIGQHRNSSTINHNNYHNRLLDNRRRFKSSRQSFSFNSTKKNNLSWFTNAALQSKKSKTGTIFLLTNFLLSILLSLLINFANGAPLPSAEVRPIWLQDGLITLDNSNQNPIDAEITDTAPGVPILEPNTALANQFGRVLLKFGLPPDNREINQQVSLVGDENENRHQFPVAPTNGYFREALRQPSEDEKEQELFWIERRRLDRDRALEPPPWLREQPTRRGFGPVSRNVNGYLKNNINGNRDINIDDHDDEGTSPTEEPNGGQMFRLRLSGRQSRQSTDDQLYEEILKHLIEGTLENGPLLDEMYDELELRAKSNQQPMKPSSSSSSSSSLPIAASSQQTDNSILFNNNILSGKDHSVQQPQQRIIQQQQAAQRIQTESNKNLLDLSSLSSLDTDPDSTLIVARDEISNGDDVAPVEVTMNSRQSTNSAHSQASNLGRFYENLLQNNGEKFDSTNTKDMTLSLPAPTTRPVFESASGTATGSIGSGSGFYGVRPDQANTAALKVGAQLSMLDPDSETMVRNLQRVPVPSSSFHVVEDIDQVDGAAQEAPMQQTPSADNDEDQLQESQFVEENQWTPTGSISSRSEAQKRAIISELIGAAGETAHRPFERSSSAAILMWPTQSVFAEHSNLAAPEEEAESRRHFYQTQTNKPTYELALKIIESAYLSREQLLEAATKMRAYLEDSLGLSRHSIIGLYPMSTNQLLVKVNTRKLSANQMINMIQNYDYARGFIVVSWTNKGRQQSPLPLFSAILRMLALKSNQNNDEFGAKKEFIRSAGISDQLALVEPIANGEVENQNESEQYEPYNQVDNGKANQWNRQRGLLSNGPSIIQRYFDSASVKQGLLSDPELSGNGRLAAGKYLLQPVVAAPSSPKGPVSLPILLAYLKAISPDQVAKSLHNVATIDNPDHVLPNNGSPLQANNDNSGGYTVFNNNLHMIYLLALIVALVGTFFALKLVMRGTGKQVMRHRFGGSMRSLWSSESVSDSGSVVAEQAQQNKELEATNFVRCLSNDSDLSKIVANEDEQGGKKNVDLLTRKLFNLLNGRPLCNLGTTTEEKKDEKRNNDPEEEIDEASVQGTELVLETGDGQPTRFRTSRSYIKSLIDVLSKAKSQIHPTRLLNVGQQTPVLGSKLSPVYQTEIGGAAKYESSQVVGRVELENEQQDPGILISQMDISAAHLILAYMEKHLEDKERLKREWLELNAGACLTSSLNKRNPLSTCLTSGATKMSQLMLQRLAKVALSEQNRHKNRSCLVVPFDRNRVKLGTNHNQHQHGSPGKPSGAATNVSAASSLQTRNAKAGQEIKSDYINASYIYDDEPKRPTHIIAQGPSEQTSGQFWQMVWEQEISVIVMLTRLNENSTRMCHCYWPTNGGQVSTNGSGGSGSTSPPPIIDDLTNGDELEEPILAAAVAISAATSNGSAFTASANGRRSSVTSVFNTAGARHNANGQPIIANRYLSNNILSFDISLNSSFDEEVEITNLDHINANTNSISIDSDNSKSKSTIVPYSSPTNRRYTVRFEVHLVSEHVSSNDYLVRNMYMINRSTGETRTITQFHYLAWPDGGVPDNVKSFLQFRRKVHKSYRNLKSPILVHCSDGAGRSGTYTLIDIILERIKNGAKEIDFRATLEHLRDQRTGLCSTQSQFEFVLMALAEEIQIILNALPQ